MEKSPKNFVLLCTLFFVACTIIALITIPEIIAYTNIEDSNAATALAIAAGVFGAGGGIGVGMAGSAAISAITEKPEVFIRAFMIVSLAEAVAIYGLLLGIMVFGKIG
ncbi:MAG: ATP synthase subunit C [Candidatus Helarchaeota archaeon]|nr:ATP synthase subunit C [Candidatus Helarchaeota archaeon]